MFNIALPAGLKSWIVSSWKLLISATVMLSLEVLRTSPVYDVPILPTTKFRVPFLHDLTYKCCGCCLSVSSRYGIHSALFKVICKLDFTPYGYSCIFKSKDNRAVNRYSGTYYKQVGVINYICGISPRIILTSQSFGSFALTSLSASFSLPSYKVIIAPVCARSLTAPIPLTPVPTTTIFLPSTFIITLFLSHFALSQDMGVYFQNFSDYRCCDCSSVVNSLRFINDAHCHDLRVLGRRKSDKEAMYLCSLLGSFCDVAVLPPIE